MKMDCTLKKNFSKPSCIKDVGEAEFKMVIPKNDNSGKPIKHKILSKYISKINGRFGGSTTIPTVKGCYSTKEGNKNVFFCERNFEITAVRDFQTPYNRELRKLNSKQRLKRLSEDYKFMKSLARKAGQELGQDSIFIESDYINDASFIKGNFSKKVRKKKLESKKAMEFLEE